MHGVLLGYNSSGAIVPLPNVPITAIPYIQQGTVSSTRVITNSNGYYSVYYMNGIPSQFLSEAPGYGHEDYYFLISGVVGNCSYNYTSQPDFVWDVENATDPSSSTYFVDGAETVVNLPVLPCL
jgi:hypothetical protein